MGITGYSLGKRYAQVEVDVSEVTEGLNDFNVRTKRALWKYLDQDVCPMLTNYMRAEHPWKNRSRTAEIGLNARVVKSGNMKRDDYSLGVELSHSAYNDRGQEYGMFLEYASGGFDKNGNPIGVGVQNFRAKTGFNKPYPILMPTAIRMSPKVLEDMQGIVDYYG